MPEIDCPSDGCDYSTDSKRGASIHFSSEHPEQEYDFSSKEMYSCDFCDDSFKRYAYRVNGENKFCSKSCKDKFEGSSGLDTECAECGEDVHIPPSQVKEVGGYEQKNYFCDKECESSFKSREWVGEKHPSWNGGKVRCYCDECGDQYMVIKSEQNKRKYCSTECMYEGQSVQKQEYSCVNCGDTVLKKPYSAKGKNVVCSKECFKEYMRSIRKGEDNPQWEGGRFPYYGPNWNEQREKALERDDYECQECGMTMEEHLQRYDKQLDVHHKVKRRQIVDEENPTVEQFEVTNSLTNLVTACCGCHRRLESS